MAYEEKDGDIKLFVGRKYEYSLRQQRNSGVKNKIRYPSLEGYVVINGEQKRIAMWTWTSKKTGKKFWSGTVTLEEEEQVKRSRRKQTEQEQETQSEDELQKLGENLYDQIEKENEEQSKETNENEDSGNALNNLSW